MEKRWCNACGESFEPRPQTPRQLYCAKAECQQSRKRLWQKTKRKTDDDYHENQTQAQSSWRRDHPDYWRRYRESHPEYTAANRQQQKQRNARRSPALHESQIANSDASPKNSPVLGIFKLIAIAPTTFAGQHEWTVQISLAR
ncbi:hypothetical protein [Acidovorax sp. 1608163]|uniref:hypothetical protein n=1 Tax=Acidovorax sp. 1608163 TaxID=2478662 RepID=UPI0013CE6183|nr:hypothetical protein [Acidovorax sp. 1608163]